MYSTWPVGACRRKRFILWRWNDQFYEDMLKLNCTRRTFRATVYAKFMCAFALGLFFTVWPSVLSLSLGTSECLGTR